MNYKLISCNLVVAMLASVATVAYVRHPVPLVVEPVQPTTEKLVADALLDPESARFRNIYTAKETGTICGEVNSKNRYGGYVGYTRFMVQTGDVLMGDSEPALDAIVIFCGAKK